MEKQITIVTGCKNRTVYLLQSLPSWLYHVKDFAGPIAEILIVDWESDEKIQTCLEKQYPSTLNPKISIVRVESKNNQPLAWHLAACLNFATRFVKTSQLLKVDVDYKLDPLFFQKHILSPNCFFRGNYKIARNSNETHLNGALFCWTNDLKRIGGYNEYIRTYGYDDTNLYERFENNKVIPQDFNYDFISHIPHPESLRCENNDSKLSIMKNMFIADKCQWEAKHYEQSAANYIWSSTKGTCYCVENPWRFQVNSLLDEECTDLAKKCILNDHYGLDWNLTLHKTIQFINFVYQMRDRPKFIIRALNGLGNKLRTIASAATICKKLNWLLVIEWIPDLHCQVIFPTLFESQNLLISDTPITLKNPSSSRQISNETMEYLHRCSSSSSSSSSSSIAPLSSTFHLTSFDHSMLKQVQEKGFYYISSACVFKSAFTNYNDESQWTMAHFLPLPRLLKKIEFYEKKIPIRQCIGIHSRRGQSIVQHKYESYSGWSQNEIKDCQRARKQSHFMFFIREMKRIIQKNSPNTKNFSFYISADRYSTYLAFQKAFATHKNVMIYFLERTKYDRTEEEIDAAIIDLSLLRKTKYVLASPWSTFSETVGRLGTRCQVAAEHFSASYRGVLMYQTELGENLGDNIQSLAAIQYFDQNDFDYFMNRDLHICKKTEWLRNPIQEKQMKEWIGLDKEDGGGMDLNIEKELQHLLPIYPESKENLVLVKIIFNGWLDGRFTQWPLPEIVSPLFISLHINEDLHLTKDPKYQHLHFQSKQSLFDSEEKIQYWKKFAPIGCRDLHTMNLFNRYSIPAYYSSCLSLSLKNQIDLSSLPPQKDRPIYCIDAHHMAEHLFQTLVPQDIQKKVIYLMHHIPQDLSNHAKLEQAQSHLKLYQKANYIITSRLHAALPCLAYNIPVLFLLPDMNKDCRFDDTLMKLLGDGKSLPLHWNWISPSVSPEVQEMIHSFQLLQQKKVHEWLTV